MLAIAIAAFFTAAGAAALATIAMGVKRGMAEAVAIRQELAALERAGRGVTVIALPALRSRGAGFDRAVQPRKAVTLRPVRRTSAAA